VDAHDCIGVGPGQARGDPGAKVAAVGGVPRIAKAVGHQPVPQRGDRVGAEPARRRRGGEAEPGQRRHDDGERVRGVTAVRLRVGQQGEQVQVLAERARPAVGQQQRQRVWPATGRMDQVQQLTIQVGPQVGQLVQPGLEP